MRFLILFLIASCGTTATPRDILRNEYNVMDPYCFPLNNDVWECHDSGHAYTCINERGSWTCTLNPLQD